MSPLAPSLIVAVIGPDRKQAGVLARIGEKFRRQGLKTHILRNWRDTAVNGCEILLISCGEEEVDLLAQRMEHLWMQKWNSWYATAQERRSASDAE